MGPFCTSPYSPLAISHSIQLRPGNAVFEDLHLIAEQT